MANRAHHKRQRREILTRIAGTGESYQQAYNIVAGGDPAVDLIPVQWFGSAVWMVQYADAIWLLPQPGMSVVWRGAARRPVVVMTAVGVQ